MSPKETDNHQTLSKQIFRRHFHMVLIKQREIRGVVADFECTTFDS